MASFSFSFPKPILRGDSAQQASAMQENMRALEIWINTRLTVSVDQDHGALNGLADDDHTQYLNTARHSAIGSNPHGVTFSQAVTADAGTDVTAAEAETLTDGSNADALHMHASGPSTLEALTDVTITTIASGELLKWNGSAWVNNTLAEAGIQAVGGAPTAHTIASHSDTTATGAELETLTDGSNADVLHVHTESAITDLGAYLLDVTMENFSSMADVSIVAAAAGHILEFTGGVWANNTKAAAGISEVGHDHDSSYVELSGDTMTGDLKVPNVRTDSSANGLPRIWTIPLNTHSLTNTGVFELDATIFDKGLGTSDPVTLQVHVSVALVNTTATNSNARLRLEISTDGGTNWTNQNATRFDGLSSAKTPRVTLLAVGYFNNVTPTGNVQIRMGYYATGTTSTAFNNPVMYVTAVGDY